MHELFGEPIHVKCMTNYTAIVESAGYVWVPGAGAEEKARVLPGEESLLLSFPGWLPGDLDYLPPQNNMMEEESDEIQYVQRP